VVADLKVVDGAEAEVLMAWKSGARAATVVGEASVETINIFISECRKLKMISMIDMVGVKEPLRTLRRLQIPPDVVVLHRGRDEEQTRGKVIEYRHVNRIKSKFDVLISAAGGVDLKEARSAVFNGANIVAVNVVKPEDPWTGISIESNIAKLSKQFLETIE
jgi:3-keto-L-gulonate-6-phosphate decarboxylase